MSFVPAGSVNSRTVTYTTLILELQAAGNRDALNALELQGDPRGVLGQLNTPRPSHVDNFLPSGGSSDDDATGDPFPRIRKPLAVDFFHGHSERARVENSQDQLVTFEAGNLVAGHVLLGAGYSGSFSREGMATLGRRHARSQEAASRSREKLPS
jgi:hypothetical protein